MDANYTLALLFFFMAIYLLLTYLSTISIFVCGVSSNPVRASATTVLLAISEETGFELGAIMNDVENEIEHLQETVQGWETVISDAVEKWSGIVDKWDNDVEKWIPKFKSWDDGLDKLFPFPVPFF